MIIKLLKPVAFGLLSVLAFSACDKKPAETETTTQTQPSAPAKPTVQAPAFNPDSAYAFVAKQVAFGPRVPNTPAHRKTSAYLANKLRSYGARVIEQDFTATAFDGKQLQLKNIMAQFNPTATKRVLLAAHWDTRPFADKDSTRQGQPIDGANDGASGVGVLMEIARQLSLDTTGKPTVGVDIIFFDGEDYGYDGTNTDKVAKPAPGTNPTIDTWCLGSQHWGKNRVPQGYTAQFGILLDMVGAKGARFAREGQSRMYAPQVVQKIWGTASQLGYSNVFIPVDSEPITDDHQYVMQLTQIPMADIIEYNVNGENYFGDYHHTHADNIELIDPSTLKAVGQTLLQILYNE